jgi:hypothetical protein
MIPWQCAVSVQGADDLMEAARAHRAAGAPGPLVARLVPAAAAASLGPGWPRALMRAYAARWRAEEPGEAPPPVTLWVGVGAAPGLALAALADWGAEPPAVSGSALGLIVAPGVSASAAADLTARAETLGAMVAVGEETDAQDI